VFISNKIRSRKQHASLNTKLVQKYFSCYLGNYVVIVTC